MARLGCLMAGCALVVSLAAGAKAQGLEISEFLAINDGGLADEDGSHPDWIEIHNGGPAAGDLGGWHLTDDALDLSKWSFPSTLLAPGGYLVVFASDKNRARSGQPLHANFKLAGEGDYLALVAPDGATVAWQIAPAYPPQRANVSAGPAGLVDATEPLPAHSTVRWHVPTDDAFGTAWIQPGFADAGWAEGRTGLGHDVAGSSLPVLSLDFNDRSKDRTEPGFSPFVLDTVGGAEAVQFSALTRTFGDCSVTLRPVGGIGLDDRVRATPVNAGAFTQAALLRDFVFATDLSGSQGLDIEVTGLVVGGRYRVEIWSYDTGSSGSRVSDWTINGELLADDYTFDGSVAPEDNTRYRITGVATADEAGQLRIEARRERSSASYGVFLNALRITPASLLADIRTDTADAMLGRGASLYARLPFVLASDAHVTRCTLRIRYDDGFAAWLNGTEIARRNAPETLGWDARATAAQPGGAALVFEEIAVPAALLAPGTNVLAVQGLNATAGDTDFFLLPVIEIRGPPSGSLRYFLNPTPGAANASGYAGLVAGPRFSIERGPRSDRIEVALECATPGAEIRYTLDGREPTAATGHPYVDPVEVSQTSVLRAGAFRAGWIPSRIETQTYIYMDQVAHQPAAPPGWPPTWGRDAEVDTNDGPSDGTVPSDYEMDPNVTGHTLPGYGIADALRALPLMAVTLDPDDFLGVSSGIYSHPLSSGDSWEKACAIEYMSWDGGGTDAFQIPAGIRIHGGSSRRPYRLQKHGFRIALRGDYGASKLVHDLFPGCGVTEFDRLVLRGFFTDGWGLVSWDPARYRPDDSVGFRDVWMKESLRAMGHPSAAGSFVHLFINGLYWGIYNLAERIDERFCAAHFGGLADDYDVIADFNELKAGTRAAWDAVQAAAAAGLETPAAYAAFTDQVDVVNLADYMLLHFFADCEDWPHHNWYAVRSRVAPGAKWRFLVWDQEIALDNHAIDRTDARDAGTPAALFQALRRNAEFRVLFSDRVHRHLSSGGALSLEASRARWNVLAAALDRPIVAESARWGDTADETPYGNTESRPGVPLKRQYTREADWLPAAVHVSDAYLPSLFEEANDYAILTELRAAVLFPALDAPSFSLRGGLVPSGAALFIGAPTGTIYVTTDGSDPRQALTGNPQGVAYSGPVVLSRPLTVRARTRNEAGEWSAVTEAGFVPGVPPTPENLVVSEMMYHPRGAFADAEFIELWNPGRETVHLAGVAFTEGIGFTFAEDAFILPGTRLVLVQSRPAFEALHGATVAVAGEFSGSLNNAGERITLTAPDGADADTEPDLLHSFVYSDAAPWPAEADGGGHSLTQIEGARDPADPGGWRISLAPDGTPGFSDAVRFAGDPQADTDANGRPDLLDYVLPDGRLEGQGGHWPLALSFERQLAADDAVCALECSDDLAEWTAVDASVGRSGSLLPGGLWRETWRPAPGAGTARYYRIRVDRR